jgi:CBS domain-containing protein
LVHATSQAQAMQLHAAMLATTLRARDFMQTELLTVRPETPLLDIHRMFAEEEIHGAPVVDEEGRVRGVVSTLDLVRALRDECDTSDTATAFFRDDRSYALAWSTELSTRLGEICASDVMTREVVTVGPNAPVAEVARTMREQRIHRVLVVEDHALLGVITSFDLLRAFL